MALVTMHGLSSFSACDMGKHGFNTGVSVSDEIDVFCVEYSRFSIAEKAAVKKSTLRHGRHGPPAWHVPSRKERHATAATLAFASLHLISGVEVYSLPHTE